MIQKVFAIWDVKGLCFGQPFYQAEIGSAIRLYSDLVNEPQSFINKHPSDYILFEIGTWDDNKGVFTNSDKHNHLGLASDYISRKPATASQNVVQSLLEKPLATTAEVNGGSL